MAIVASPEVRDRKASTLHVFYCSVDRPRGPRPAVYDPEGFSDIRYVAERFYHSAGGRADWRAGEGDDQV
jgi:hypothetical protein